MNRSQILTAIRGLACSKGAYGRLYNYLTSGTDDAEDTMEALEGKNFGDTFSLIMFLEGC